MGAGRPPEGLKHVQKLAGARQDKQRLQVILETLTGERTVESACAALGVGESRFHVLRRQALEGALAGLAPRPTGRPRKEPETDPTETERLRERVKELEIDLRAALVRTELALSMPHVLRRPKKKRRSRP